MTPETMPKLEQPDFSNPGEWQRPQPEIELEPVSLVKDEKEQPKPNRAQRRRGHRLFNTIMRRAAKAAESVPDSVIEERAKESRRVRRQQAALTRSKRNTATRTRNRNRRLVKR